MKKLALILLLLFLVSMALSACQNNEAPPPLSIGTPPAVTTEEQEPLNIEVFDETPFTNMSPFNNYEKPTNLPETTAE